MAALAGGGSLQHLAVVTFRHPWVVFVGLILQLGAQTMARPHLEESWRLLLLLGSMGFIALFLLLNLARPGMGLAGVGVLLNLVVIVANGAMPVHAPSAERAGVPISFEEAALKHEVMDPSTHFPWLGDAIAIPLLKTVISLGDVLLALGIGLFVYRAMRGPSGRRSIRGASGSAPATKP